MCSREQEPHERQTRTVPERVVSFLKGAARRTDERAEGEAHKTLERTRPQEGSSRGIRSATRSDEEDPEVVTNDVGGAPEATKALLVGHYKTLKGTDTSESRARRG